MLVQVNDPTRPAGAEAPETQLEELPPFRAPHAFVDSFLSEALARDMRAAIDRHFADPYKQNAEHQVWNYWYVPEMYTFLRTSADKVMGAFKKLHESLIQSATDDHIRETLANAGELVVKNRTFEALKIIRTLFEPDHSLPLTSPQASEYLTEQP